MLGFIEVHNFYLSIYMNVSLGGWFALSALIAGLHCKYHHRRGGGRRLTTTDDAHFNAVTAMISHPFLLLYCSQYAKRINFHISPFVQLLPADIGGKNPIDIGESGSRAS